MSEVFENEYAALTTSAGIVDFGDRTQLELTGPDRAQFLHNLCTNSVRNLAPGSGCEAFLLNVKGHILGHVFIFAGPDSHILETTPGQAATLLAHLDRYLIREDVQLTDRSAEWDELLLAGPKAESLLGRLDVTTQPQRLSHSKSTLVGQSIWVRRFDFTGPGDFVLAFERPARATVIDQLTASGAISCGPHAAEAARIEYGAPLFGRDISEANLPQEVDRNSLAISFTKGCYLGQETVARIDALGHVNQLLRGVRFLSGNIPNADAQLMAEPQPPWHLTSACWSPRLKTALALAYVRRGHEAAGTVVDCAFGQAEIMALPVQT